MVIQDYLAHLCYGFLTSKKPGEKDGKNAFFIWLLKYLAGQYFFTLHEKYYDFWSWATQYYPFSLFYQNRAFHYKNLPIDKFMLKLQNLIGKANIPTTIMTGEYGVHFCEFYGTFNKKSDNTPENIQTID